MKKLILVAVAALLLAACAVPGGLPLATETVAPTVPAGEPKPGDTPMSVAGPTREPANGAQLPGTLDELIAALEAAGATVVRGDKEEVDAPFWLAPVTILTVDGERVEVFEFGSAEERATASAGITPDGQPSSAMIVEWVGSAHFWASGRIIVLYVGFETNVVAQLTEVLGLPVGQSQGPGMVPPEGDYPPAVQAAVAALTGAQSLKPEAIAVVDFEQVEWSDSCLGVNRRGEMCAQVITPGYRVVLDVNGQEYVFHTNLDGTIVREAGNPGK